MSTLNSKLNLNENYLPSQIRSYTRKNSNASKIINQKLILSKINTSSDNDFIKSKDNFPSLHEKNQINESDMNFEKYNNNNNNNNKKDSVKNFFNKKFSNTIADIMNFKQNCEYKGTQILNEKLKDHLSLSPCFSKIRTKGNINKNLKTFLNFNNNSNNYNVTNLEYLNKGESKLMINLDNNYNYSQNSNSFIPPSNSQIDINIRNNNKLNRENKGSIPYFLLEKRNLRKQQKLLQLNPFIQITNNNYIDEAAKIILQKNYILDQKKNHLKLIEKHNKKQEKCNIPFVNNYPQENSENLKQTINIDNSFITNYSDENLLERKRKEKAMKRS